MSSGIERRCASRNRSVGTKNLRRVLVAVALWLAACSSKGSNKIFISIPGATFRQGTPPPASGTSTAPAATHIVASPTTLAMGSSVTWTVQWSASVVVTEILFHVEKFGGYYEIPVDGATAESGAASFVMSETEASPGLSGCAGTWCWQEAPQDVTTADASVTLVGPSEDVGTPLGGIGLSWGDSGGNPAHCPTADELLCCHSSGGIQVLGAPTTAGCACPANTCSVPSGGPNYCGCAACGGCP